MLKAIRLVIRSAIFYEDENFRRFDKKGKKRRKEEEKEEAVDEIHTNPRRCDYATSSRCLDESHSALGAKFKITSLHVRNGTSAS